MQTRLALPLILLLALLLAPIQPTSAEEDDGGTPPGATAKPPGEEDTGDDDGDEDDGTGILEAPGEPLDEGTAEPTAPVGPTYRQRGPVRPLRDENTPAGMVRVPAGVAVIGTKAKRLASLLRGRPPTISAQFQFEVPEHYRPMPGFYVDEFEVSNAQYHAFLMDAAHVVHQTAGQLANLEEVAGYLLRLPQSEWEKPKLGFWRQLYEANKAQLHEKMPDTVVKNAAGQVDEEQTARAFRRVPLIRGLELAFYDLQPPMDWQGITPDEDLKDHPVRGVSYNDAERFAEWAGKHIPTEFEWEYVGRGPEGYYFPWGDEWFPNASRANWGGKIVRRFVPITVPVDGDLKPADLEEDVEWVYDGMSWCGAWHMLGNVAEWTSSWFNAYPDPDVTRDHKNMGEYAKVIRGAGLRDAEPLVLRLAARNFLGGGMKQPPTPGNHFENVGFRCAWYGNPGQDQLAPVLRRVARGRRVKPEHLALDQWVGAAALQFAPDGAAVQDHVYVVGRAHSILLVPLKTMLGPDHTKPKIKKRNDLLKFSADPQREDPIPLALFHTDVGLSKVYVLDREAAAAAAASRSGGRRRRQKPKAPPVKEGTCRPGSYVLAFWHQRLCVVQPSLEFVCFLSKGPIDAAFLDVKKPKPEKIEPPMLELTPVADLVQIAFSIPVGGKGTHEDLRVVVDGVLLNTEKGALEAAGTWKNGAYEPVPAELLAAAAAADQAEAAAAAEENGKKPTKKPGAKSTAGKPAR